jgi:hypothetical protein
MFDVYMYMILSSLVIILSLSYYSLSHNFFDENFSHTYAFTLSDNGQRFLTFFFYVFPRFFFIIMLIKTKYFRQLELPNTKISSYGGFIPRKKKGNTSSLCVRHLYHRDGEL